MVIDKNVATAFKNFLLNYAEVHGLPSPVRNVNRVTQSIVFLFNGLMESTKRGKKKVDLLHDGGEGPTFIHRAGILIHGMTSQLYHIDIIMISLITSSLHHTSVWYDVSMTYW